MYSARNITSTYAAFHYTRLAYWHGLFCKNIVLGGFCPPIYTVV